MSVVLWLAVGLIFGWIAGMLADNRAGRAAYLVIGSVGALVGGFLFSLFGGLGISGIGILMAMIGSGVLSMLYLGISRRRT